MLRLEKLKSDISALSFSLSSVLVLISVLSFVALTNSPALPTNARAGIRKISAVYLITAVIVASINRFGL